MNGRSTLNRAHTDEDTEFARAVIQAVMDNGGEIHTQAEVSRLSGVQRSRLTARVMTLARIMTPEVYPGMALLTRFEGPHGYVYRITDAADIATEAHLRTAKALHTMTRRMHAEVTPLRTLSDLPSVNMVDLADSIWANLHSRENTYNAIIAAMIAEAAASKPEALPGA